MFDDWNNILLISSHADDVEVSMGGTVSRFIEKGYDVHHLILSYSPIHSIAKGYNSDIRIEESIKANELLGIKKSNHHIVNPCYENDYFHIHRQEIANTFHRMKEIVNPDVVFVSSSFDTHQDHQVVHNEAKRIFKEIGIIGYEFPYNNFRFNYDLIIGLTEQNMNNKMNSLKHFKSQHEGVYFDREYLMGLATINAIRIKMQYPYAEAFEVVRLVW